MCNIKIIILLMVMILMVMVPRSAVAAEYTGSKKQPVRMCSGIFSH